MTFRNPTGIRKCSFPKAFKLFWIHYVDFFSKSTPSEFWWWKLWAILIKGCLYLIFTLSLGSVASLMFMGSKIGTGLSALTLFRSLGASSVLLVVILLAMLIPSMALRTRRFADTGLPKFLCYTLTILRAIFWWLAVLKATLEWFTLIYVILLAISLFLELLPSNELHRHKKVATN